MRVIPGYCYDPARDRYFKLTDRLPSRKSIIQCREAKLNEFRSKLSEAQLRSFPEDFENLSVLKYSSKKELFQKSRFHHMIHRRRFSLSFSISSPVVLVDKFDSEVHFISTDGIRCHLSRYELKWTPPKHKDEQTGFALHDTMTHMEPRDYVFCLDARLNTCAGKFATLSPRRLNFLEYNDDRKAYQHLQTFKLNRCHYDSRFALETSTMCGKGSPIMLFNHSTISAFDNGIVSLLHRSNLHARSGISLVRHGHSQYFTAVGQVDNDYPTQELNAYVAVGGAFSLLRFTLSRSRGRTISPRATELVEFMYLPDTGDIVHLQCLQTPSFERTGVIVGRSDGRVELWEDRQPKGPVVVYKESIGSADENVAQFNYPRPVIDTPSHSYVAMPLKHCGAIGMWHLQTGELINLLKCDQWYQPGSLDSSPPVILMRSQLGCGGSAWPFCGPFLMSIQNHLVDLFY